MIQPATRKYNSRVSHASHVKCLTIRSCPLMRVRGNKSNCFSHSERLRAIHVSTNCSAGTISEAVSDVRWHYQLEELQSPANKENNRKNEICFLIRLFLFIFLLRQEERKRERERGRIHKQGIFAKVF